jgi:hypothetical protein
MMSSSAWHILDKSGCGILRDSAVDLVRSLQSCTHQRLQGRTEPNIFAANLQMAANEDGVIKYDEFMRALEERQCALYGSNAARRMLALRRMLPSCVNVLLKSWLHRCLMENILATCELRMVAYIVCAIDCFISRCAQVSLPLTSDTDF